MAVFASRSQTELAVRLQSLEFLLYLLYVISFWILIAPSLGSYVSGAPFNPVAFGGYVQASIIISFLLFFALILPGAALGVLAVISFYLGRNEDGPEHARNVRRAFRVLSLAAVVALVSIVAGLADASAITSVTALAASFLGGLSLFWFSRTLLTPRLLRWARAALAIPLVAAASFGLLVLVAQSMYPQPSFDPDYLNRLWSYSLLVLATTIVMGLIGLLGLLAWFVVFRGIDARFRRGEIGIVTPSSVPPSLQPTVRAAYDALRVALRTRGQTPGLPPYRERP